MHSILAPFFIGRSELNLDLGVDAFQCVLPSSLVDVDAGSMDAINRINSAISDNVFESISVGEKPLLLSGDCVSAIGCLAGLERHGVRPLLLWFDAHGDFHTPQTTISGHLGGMPLASITGRGNSQLLSSVKLTPLPDESVFLIGARDLESGEAESLNRSGVRVFENASEILAQLPQRRDVWIHFDTDFVNPKCAPAMRYPAAGGPTARQTRLDFGRLANHIDFLGLSVSGWAPHLDCQQRTARTCWECIEPIRAKLSFRG